MAALLDTPGAVDERVGQVRAALADRAGHPVPVRIAASIAHLGVCARVVAPALAAQATTGSAGYDRLDSLWWQPRLGGAFPLSAAGGGSGDLGELIDGDLARLSELMSRRFRLSALIVRGNVASAVNGAVLMLGRVRPDLARAARELAAAVSDGPALTGTGTGSGPGFRRRSCCLIYRVGDGGRAGVCGDCVLRP